MVKKKKKNLLTVGGEESKGEDMGKTKRVTPKDGKRDGGGDGEGEKHGLWRDT